MVLSQPAAEEAHRTGPIKTRMKRAVRGMIAALPAGDRILGSCRYLLERYRLARIGNTAQIFRHHCEVNEWGSRESVSGPGSTPRYTENIPRMIPPLVRDLEVRRILDAPCGDYHWFRMIRWETEIDYIGGDIVEALVARNQSLYDGTNRKFVCLDIVRDILPQADLWLCRDCFFHLSNRDILLAVDNFLRSDIRYLLTTTHLNCDRNHDIASGAFRLLNLELPPFSFGRPSRVIDDWIEGYPVRYLALWERDTLASSLASNRAFQRIARRG